jgi:glycosyltransferase involved in cell wall biosynthesis
MKVTISAVIANYNHSHVIQKALNNLLKLKDFFCEILVLDDCSTDNSIEVLKEYAKKNPIIKLLQNGKNMGVCFSYNRLFREAKGQYIVQQAADDYLLVDGMSALLQHVIDHPGAGYYCGNYFLEYPDTGTLKSIPHFFKEGLTSAEEATSYVHGQGFAQVGNIIKRSAILEFKGYRPEIMWNTDWFMNNAIAITHGFYYVPIEVAVMVVDDKNSYGAQRLIWCKQKQSLKSILYILKHEYPDSLYPLFVHCHILNTLGWSMLRYTITTPKEWDWLLLKYLVSCFYQKIRHGILPFCFPIWFKNIYKKYRDKILLKQYD